MDEERERIEKMIAESPYEHLGAEPARYYLVDRFAPTSFRKTSKHGIQGHRYFDLDDPNALPKVAALFADCESPSIEVLAETLSQETWG
ncbi:MAG: hypothetical protein AAF800_05300 [Planctomycetota bacterium]